MKNVVDFKSVPEMYSKEAQGLKPNTIRKLEEFDPRFRKLSEWMASGRYGFIRIRKVGTRLFFVKPVQDVSFYEGWWIISWSP